jgi:hypothetical protein
LVDIDANAAVGFFPGFLIVVLAANASATLLFKLAVCRGYAWWGGDYRRFWDDAYYGCVSGSLVPLAMSLCCRMVLGLVNASFLILIGGTGEISRVDEPEGVTVGGNKLRCQCDWRNAKPATHLSALW